MPAKKSYMSIALVISLISLFLISCDSNQKNPLELMSKNITIDSFTANATVVTLGESVTLSWNVEDDDDDFDIEYIYIDGGIGKVENSGSKSVTLSKTTTFTISIYIDGEEERQQSVRIEVQDDEGNPVDEEPEDEICNDEIDNDRDTLVDCDDDDCVDDSACEPVVVVEPTYEINSLSYSPSAPIVGDAVTVNWTSTCSLTTINVTDGTFEASDTTSVTMDTTTQSFTVYCYGGEYNGLQGSQTVLIMAEEEDTSVPSFDASVSFRFTEGKSDLLFGMEFTIEWVVTNYSKIELNDNPALETGSISETVNTDETYDYELHVWDPEGEERTFKKSIDVYDFGDNSSSVGTSSGIIDMVPTKNSAEFFIISETKILHTTDAGDNFDEISKTWSGTIRGFNVVSDDDGDHKMYLATSSGPYYASSLESDFVKISQMSNSTGSSLIDFDADAIYPRSNGDVIVASDQYIIELKEVSSSSCSGSAIYVGGFCQCPYFFNLPGSDNDVQANWSDQASSSLRVKRFIKKANSTQKVVAITNRGTYYSNDSAGEFHTELSDFDHGMWESASNGYFWNKGSNFIHYYTGNDSDSFTTLSLGASGISNINAVYEMHSYVFVATDTNVYYLYDGQWYKFDNNDTPGGNYLMAYRHNDGVVAPDSGYQRMMSWDYTLNMITTGGTKYDLDWVNNPLRLELSGTNNFPLTQR
jgi:hypothetical protein